MSEEKKEDKITLEITLPTKESMVNALLDLFPGIKVTVKPAERSPARTIEELSKESAKEEEPAKEEVSEVKEVPLEVVEETVTEESGEGLR